MGATFFEHLYSSLICTSWKCLSSNQPCYLSVHFSVSIEATVVDGRGNVSANELLVCVPDVVYLQQL